MSTSQKRRTKFTSIHDNKDTVKSKESSNNLGATRTEISAQKIEASKQHEQNKLSQPATDMAVSGVWKVANFLFGLSVMVFVSGLHARQVYQLHENHLWFTNIKEVEREISFRTESGLYYSYYKQLVHSKSLLQGIKDLREDKLTEHPDTINVLERMNIYQEVLLAAIYRQCGISLEPILFYIYSIFSLQVVLVCGVYLLAWCLSNSWLAGLFSTTLYIFNRLDTTRVSNSGPLRENFSLPFLWMQAAALAVYFKPRQSALTRKFSLFGVGASTFLFCLFWQLNQFVMMLQAFSLFGVWVLGILPAHKVRNIMLIQLASLLAVCLLQFGNKMILGSLCVSFIIVATPFIHILGNQTSPHSIPVHLLRVFGFSIISLILMVLTNFILKIIIDVDSDEHIFKFVENKFGLGDERDFDSRLYLCLGIFGFITQDVFERLTTNWTLPLYLPTHLAALLWLAFSVIARWRLQNYSQDQKAKSKSKSSELVDFGFSQDLAYHTVQAVFFGGLAMLILRMKYFWTPYVCVFAAVGVCDARIWTKLLGWVGLRRPAVVNVVRVSFVVVLLSVVVGQLLPPALEELKVETEFWDPDTVELMEWIVAKTPPGAAFTGSMQLLAGVKLCTGRPVTNHPHYEDKYLRLKTLQLYQIYGRRSPKDVHAILKRYDSHYIILEDSICRAPSRGGCRTPDLVDISNGVSPDEPVNISGLIRSTTPRFCEAVRHQKPAYAKYFRSVLVNKTFRVYKVL
ncbi:Dpy-19-like protein 3 [Elysia marginata]|uniref:Dpy-19-like protein 3 n=1 Tax=Elysia marginata TaxID=1093978 RepID=A0AAV4EGJ9_9GAST|nr:Dpy-19-like protein 3 [Elysia marginata]